MPRLLFVCLGNICRSPAAEGIARAVAKRDRLDWQIDSAGTGAWHVGAPPDARMVASAAARGLDLSQQRARQARPEDFRDFDHIFAMDRNNVQDLSALRPENARARLHLFLGDQSVPDPYYGGEDGFEQVLDMIQTRMEALAQEIV
ncbi:MAG: low molecular weight protein-tyrosine-phosphatase [Pseudomonadota bacterium]